MSATSAQSCCLPARARGHPDSRSGFPAPCPRCCAARITELEREVASLRAGLRSRQYIGEVSGLLAYRYQCTPSRAWAVLQRLSQDVNVKLRDIAGVLHRHYCGEPLDAGEARVLAAVQARLPELPVLADTAHTDRVQQSNDPAC